MTQNRTIELHFVHPRTSIKLIADVSPQITGTELLAELLRDAGEGAFLSGSSSGYELVIRRTQQAITPNLTLEEAGVMDGDEIDVFVCATGGGPDWSQLGEMLFWSTAAASVFLKAAAPIIVEFLKAKSSRSITIQRGEDKMVITGHDSDKVSAIWDKMIGKNETDKLWPPLQVKLKDPENTKPPKE